MIQLVKYQWCIADLTTLVNKKIYRSMYISTDICVSANYWQNNSRQKRSRYWGPVRVNSDRRHGSETATWSSWNDDEWQATLGKFWQWQREKWNRQQHYWHFNQKLYFTIKTFREYWQSTTFEGQRLKYSVNMLLGPSVWSELFASTVLILIVDIVDSFASVKQRKVKRPNL